VGSTTLAALRANMSRLRPLDDHLGGADTYRMYLAEVEKTARVLNDANASTSTRRELLTLFAEEAQQAGWAAFDAGWQGEAHQLFERSFAAAREADNASLAANALALRSYQLLATGTVATDLTDKSCSMAANSGDPAVRSLLFQRGAWTYAVAGDTEKTARSLGLAEAALVAPDHGEPSPGWAQWAHNPTELRIMAGRCWAELHKPLRAVPALEAAMAEYDDRHARDKALYLSSLADAYLDAGELDRATAITDHAIDLAVDVASARPYQRLGAVLDRLEAHKSATSVAELLTRRPLNPVQVRR
jgi:tetratricopeptide (TPR) repeat protein